MLKNYFKIALRTLRKQPGYSIINISGLAIGLAVCTLILLFVYHELSYDGFHEHSSEIYRVNLTGTVNGKAIETATSPAPMGAALVRDYPEVVSFTRIDRLGRVLVNHEDRIYYEERVYRCDSSFFDVFSFPVIKGDPKKVLTQPGSLVLSESLARKYFGDEDPVGRTLRLWNTEEFQVTGIVADVPSNSHFRFDMLMPFGVQDVDNSNWGSNNLNTYIVLKEGAEPELLEAKLPDFFMKYIAPEIEKVFGKPFSDVKAGGIEWGYYLQPLKRVHLYSRGIEGVPEPGGDITYVYTFSAIALFILLIACINFMNLATARSSNRAKEIGVRKVLGSERRQIISQFLGESMLMALVSSVIALALIFFALKPFNQIAGKELTFVPAIGLMLIGIALLSGLLAGIYPAFVLSAFRPVTVLSRNLTFKSRSSVLRSFLVVFQFAISITLLAGTGIVYQQLRFMQKKQLGFEKEQVLTVRIQSDELRNGFESFRQELLSNPKILQVAASNGIPGRISSDNLFLPEGSTSEQVVHMRYASVTHEFLKTYGMNLLAGRDFSREFTTDDKNTYVINETACRTIGWKPEEAINKTLTVSIGSGDQNNIPGRIIGVVQDFHFESLRQSIGPITLSVNPGNISYLSIRVAPEGIPETLSFLSSRIRAYQPGYPFEYTFLDEDFGRFFHEDVRLGQVVTYFTILAIIIACLGLFGLASYATQLRTKEIGIRKVCGAKVSDVVLLLSRDFSRLVVIASVIAFPLAYLGMRKWLDGFAYRVEISPWILIGAGVVAFSIAWLTVSYQSIKAAILNPAKILRSE